MGNLVNLFGDWIRLLAQRLGGRLPKFPAHPPWEPPVVTTPLRAEGWGDGLHPHDYPYSGVALLNTFYFLMTKGRSIEPEIDHHLEQIMLLLDFRPPNELRLGFHDIADNDMYRYTIAHHAIQGEDVRTGVWGQDIGVGSYKVQLDRPAGDWVFVLRGFQMAFRGVDHHIDEIGIRENNGVLTVDFKDRSAPTFLFEVQYAWVPADLFVLLGSSHGTAKRYDLETIPSGRVVIRGFHLDFSPINTPGDDHHIAEIGVLGRDGGRIDVVYSDAGGGDAFTWLVNWGLLGRGNGAAMAGSTTEGSTHAS